MSKITVTRSYEITIDDEAIERFSGITDLEELLKEGCLVASRLADQGDLIGTLYLIDTVDEVYWTDEPSDDDDIIDEIAYQAQEVMSEVTGA